MNYTDVLNKIPKEDFLKFCLHYNKTPAEIGKHLLDIENDVDTWNKAHIEYGKLENLTEKDYENVSDPVFMATWTSKREAFGTTERQARSNFLKVEDPIIKKWGECIGHFCRFYISYTENKDDGTVYRVLLDIEAID